MEQVGTLVAQSLDSKLRFPTRIHSCLFCHTCQHQIQMCSCLESILPGSTHMVPGHMSRSRQVLAVVLAVEVLETWLVQNCLVE